MIFLLFSLAFSQTEKHNIKDIVEINIQDAQGVTLFGNRVLEKELAHEVN